MFGKQVHEEGLEFGEKVMYRLKRTQDANVVLDARWLPGIWLGRTWGSISQRSQWATGRWWWHERSIESRWLNDGTERA